MLTGEANPQWKGGRSVASTGYMLVRVGLAHHLADVRGYAYEHRIVAERKIGRRLRRGEIVHHRDQNKLNNDPSNLEILTRRQHRFEHRSAACRNRKPGERNRVVKCVCGCGAKFRRYDDSGRPRRWVSGHNGHKVVR